MDKRNTGNKYEDLACEYLLDQGCQILERNFKSKTGEIDIIIKDNDYIVFIEVKYRAGSEYGQALEAVNFTKQKKICRVSDFYRLKNNIDEYSLVRFDVIAIDFNGNGAQIQWLQNAFDYIPGRKF